MVCSDVLWVWKRKHFLNKAHLSNGPLLLVVSKKVCPNCTCAVQQQERQLLIINVHLEKTNELFVVSNPVMVPKRISANIRFSNMSKKISVKFWNLHNLKHFLGPHWPVIFWKTKIVELGVIGQCCIHSSWDAESGHRDNYARYSRYNGYSRYGGYGRHGRHSRWDWGDWWNHLVESCLGGIGWLYACRNDLPDIMCSYIDAEDCMKEFLRLIQVPSDAEFMWGS